MPRIIISGGGTGGHVFPAIAIADAIMEQSPEAEILFVGANGKIEMEKVPKAGYRIEGLNVVGFQRSFTWKNFLFPFKLMGSMIHALQITNRFKPDVAVGVGGYASGPILRIANSMNIPTVLQEQNSFAGITNKILAGKASKICVAYDGMDRFFPKDKILFTGNPVRKDILDNKINREVALKTLGLDQNKKTLLIFGGSLGAKTINEAVLANTNDLKARTDINIIWQVGKMYYDAIKDCGLSSCAHIKILPFIDDMDVAYSAADVVVCRAGALTISELAVLGKAAVLIPSPNVAEDHQTFNAKSLVDRNAALMVKDVDAKSELFQVVDDLLKSEQKGIDLARNILYFARPDAAKKIAAEILTICTKKMS
ncbi:MAG: undecaprenyldiphospho-muramoylpentapeptide beta-N-acetylglucosaminyltransferase [Chitinophagales bacterium]|nr:undecaprenyldiphospho-muramoylpentapeptide beta-N-acetylglucosaminyltransferase [Chitinophagales bacterium]